MLVPCKQALPAGEQPLFPCSQHWVAQAQQGTLINFHVQMLSSAKPEKEGSASLKILLPCPLHKCLWQLMWHIPCSLYAGEAERQCCLYRIQRVKFMGQLPSAIYKNLTSYLCSWLLPKKTDIADLYQCRKNVLHNV